MNVFRINHLHQRVFDASDDKSNKIVSIDYYFCHNQSSFVYAILISYTQDT